MVRVVVPEIALLGLTRKFNYVLHVTPTYRAVHFAWWLIVEIRGNNIYVKPTWILCRLRSMSSRSFLLSGFIDCAACKTIRTFLRPQVQ